MNSWVTTGLAGCGNGDPGLDDMLTMRLVRRSWFDGLRLFGTSAERCTGVGDVLQDGEEPDGTEKAAHYIYLSERPRGQITE